MYYWHWVRNIVRRPHTTGYPTEPDGAVSAMARIDSVIEGISTEGSFPRRASALRHVDGGSCNGCESELSLISSPDYDLTRYGFSFTPSPKHADVLVVTGVITKALVAVIEDVYQQMTHPKRVVALGNCPLDGYVFKNAPNVVGRLEDILPVTLSIAGCPPSPADILRGLLTAVDGNSPIPEPKEVNR